MKNKKFDIRNHKKIIVITIGLWFLGLFIGFLLRL